MHESAGCHAISKEARQKINRRMRLSMIRIISRGVKSHHVGKVFDVVTDNTEGVYSTAVLPKNRDAGGKSKVEFKRDLNTDSFNKANELHDDMVLDVKTRKL